MQEPSATYDSEIPIQDAVQDLSVEELDLTVRRNAAERGFILSDEHLHVIHTLFNHYKQDCNNGDCMAAHEHMRYLENAYAERGGGRYLHMLFDLVPNARGVLTTIHDLANLPSLRLEADKGFGTAF